ncbi:hypothetical protein WJX64_02855 [Leifsonia sp. YIM 134122]|uniref:Uncharacterized protein n=1 Tax=Leifsonia stereocauli TaxID=3134136 RepID=A0ABU9W1B8_9MICO
MSDAAHPPITRGVNPAPDTGWSWYLTDYEIAYIHQFNVRPVREGWTGSPEEIARLDQEADGVRVRGYQPAPEPRLATAPPPVMEQEPDPQPSAPSAPRRYRRWLWVLIAAVMVAGGAVAATIGIMNLNAVATLNEQTAEIEANL